MSEQLEISLLRFKTQSKKFNGVSTIGEYTQLPASPTLIKHLVTDQNIIKRYNQIREEHLANKEKPNILYERLREYQNKDVLFLSKLKNRGNFNQQRLGKTVETIHIMKEKKQVSALVMTPKSGLSIWLSAFKEWSPEIDAVVVGSHIPKPRRIEIYKNIGNKTLIISHHLIHNDIDHLLKLQFDTLIFDEPHHIRNYRNQRSNKGPKWAKSVMKLSYNHKANDRHALTGTPASKDAHTIFPILHFLYPKLFTSYWQFIDYYFKKEEQIYNYRGDSTTVIKGFKSKEKEKEMQEFLEVISVQRKRINEISWLTQLEPTTIKLTPNKKQLKIYEELHNFYELPEYGIIAELPIDRVTRERQIALDPHILDIPIQGVRTEWILDYLEDYPNKTVLIVSNLTAYLKYLNTKIPNSVLLTGETAFNQRKIIENKFNSGKIKVLLANLQSNKEAITLYGADTLILTDKSIIPEDNEQLLDRIVPPTKEIAENKELQEIYILTSTLNVDVIWDKAIEFRWTMNQIINSYAGATGVSPR